MTASPPGISFCDEIADRIDVDEGFQPAGHRLGSYDHATGQRQREKHDASDAHDGLRRADQQADGGPYPGQAEREDQQDAVPGGYPRRTAGRAESDGEPEDDDQAR